MFALFAFSSRFIKTIRMSVTLACLLAFGDIASAQPFTVKAFSPWAGYVVSNGTMLVGDFSGDGKSDVFHPVPNTDYANVWLSKGDGTFTVKPFSPWPGYAVSNGPMFVGDFNGDGKSDILHPVPNTDYANVWLSNGDGTFAVKPFSPWPGYAMSNGPMFVGDFNGDGKSDVLHPVPNTDYANIWLSKGNGTFTVKSFSPWSGYAMSNGTMMVGDFNGDHKSDIFHAVANTNYAQIWLSKGDGTFTVKSFSPWPSYVMSAGYWLTGDLNGDGKTDLLHVLGSYVNVWLSKGDGTFTVKSFTPWPGYAMGAQGSMLVGDLNGDGRADVFHAVANTDYAQIWLSNGDGTFAVTQFSPWSNYAIPNGSWYMGDFNGDGHKDIFHAVDAGADWANIWLSGLPGPNQVAVQGIEVVQAIQDLIGDVPLVSQKQTWARVYLDVNSAAPIVNASAKLQVRDNSSGSAVLLNSVATVTIPVANGFNLQATRENLANSLNFQLPAGSIGDGTRSITVSGVTTGGHGLNCSNCGLDVNTAKFSGAPPLRVRIVGLQYTTGTPAKTFTPSALDFALLPSWLGRAYPVAQALSSTTTVTASAAWPFTCNQANAQLQSLRSIEVGNGTVDSRTHYIGLVSNGAGYMRGCAAGIPGAPDPSTVASAPTGPTSGNNVPVNVNGDSDGSFGDWYGGHELGHTYGRAHPGFCNGNSQDDNNFPYPNGQLSDNAGTNVGLDVGDTAHTLPRIVLPGEKRFDIMTYCNQPQWLSPYTYEAILQRLIGEDPSLSGAPGAPIAGMGTPGAAVVGAPGSAAGNADSTSPPAATPLVRALQGPPHPSVSLTAAPVVVHGLAAAPAVIRAATTAPKPPVPAASSVPPVATFAAAAPTAAAPATPAPPPQPETPNLVLHRAPLVSIVATLNLTRGTGQIQYVRHVAQGMIPTAPITSTASIRFLDAAGNVLADDPQQIRTDSDIPAGEDKTALISAVLPETPNVAAVELVLNGSVLDRIEIAQTPPAAPVVNVNRTNNELTIRWSSPRAAQATTSRLNYDVQISSDGGNSWQTVSVGVKGNSITLAPSQLAGTQPPLVRVIPNDGFNDGSASTITVPQ
jgi:hypothetical protein